MEKNRVLKGNEIYLNSEQLEKYIEQLSIEQVVTKKSQKHTNPITNLKEDYYYITKVYELLNENIKNNITIHPAGEWLLDNYYIIEENVKAILNEMTIKKYSHLPGIANGTYKGFARIYVFANEIVKYTNNQVDREVIEKALDVYQKNKNITMEEIWNLPIFLKISIIQNIKDICEKIYIAQNQKIKAHQILMRTIESDINEDEDRDYIKNNKQTTLGNNNKIETNNILGNNSIFGYNNIEKIQSKTNSSQEYSFVEYMAYSLKKYGKKGYPYLKALEEIVEKKGISIDQIIRKEHFIIAVSKVSIGNAITSIKNISRINFQEIFDEINIVEDILRKDPLKIYEKMTYETKTYYRNVIENIAKKSGLSEIFIANKALGLSEKNYNKGFKNAEKDKESHIGYYLIDKGKTTLLKELNLKPKERNFLQKKGLYVGTFFTITIAIDLILGIVMAHIIKPIYAYLVMLALYIPITEIYLQILNYILLKKVKPQIIPKVNVLDGIDEGNKTFVVIPTIVNSKEKVETLLRKLEVFYLANKSKNLYFAVLGDCTTEKEEHKKHDDEIIKAAKEGITKLNEKYPVSENENDIKIFHFIYRKRTWSPTERKYLGWERKRGLLHQFNNYLLEKLQKGTGVFCNREEILNDSDSITIDKNENRLQKCHIPTQQKKELQKCPVPTQQQKLQKCPVPFCNFHSNFLLNTLDEEIEIPKIKYVITLDGDTILPLNTGLELVGTMAHILNRPVIKNGVVVEGYGVIQPRIGIDLNSVNKSRFTEIYAEQAGVDTYTNAISDVYEDNFREAIYTGKGIYDLEVFNKLLNDAIPENQVLSHDLLESTYLKCGLASDIYLMDGYPTKYTSYISRNHRWIRGDWQIVSWLSAKINNNENNSITNPINRLSKFKIFDNLRRSLFPIGALILLFINYKLTFILGIVSVLMPLILDLINYIVYRKETERQLNFSQSISGIKKSILKGILEVATLPDKAYTSINAIVKTLYRLKTRNNLLEWVTAEEAENLNKTDLKSYYKKMAFSVVAGALMIIYFTYPRIFLGLVWIFAPYIMWYVSKEKKVKSYKDIITTEEEQEIIDIAKKTWGYFENYMTAENNFLVPDNYQETQYQESQYQGSQYQGAQYQATQHQGAQHQESQYQDGQHQATQYQGNASNTEGRLALRTSSTNIGLSLLTIISAYDMKFISEIKALDMLENVIETINRLVKWNGHLYNWYDIRTLEPLRPRYISSVDSGNFVGYLFVVKEFLIEKGFKKELIEKLNNIINNTNFTTLYNPKINLFSIGFNIEEGKLTDCYYDFLASEARQLSFIAIALKQINPKHWANLSRTLTVLNGYKGLVSWSGTAFEYLMPNVIIKKYQDSLIDESCKFLIMSSKVYAEKLKIPWGISESAFNLKDLYGNYQYKAFGIPWLGVKRGLADEVVISPYASVLAIEEDVKGVIKNLCEIKNLGGIGKYGLYEAIDFTPERLQLQEKYAVVKAYMAHHQALIMLSINNLLNNEILKKRFSKNPEIEAVDILLQEKMPRNIVITKTKKEKVEKLKYKDYEDFAERNINKLLPFYENTNVISNDEYIVFTNDKGESYSKYKDIYINRYKKTADETQGIKFYIRNKKTNKIWSSVLNNISKLPTNYNVTFNDAENTFERLDGNISTKLKITISPEDNVEIRNLSFKNYGEENEILEIHSILEPVLSTEHQDNAHPAFNSMSIEFSKSGDNIIINRRMKTKEEENLYLAVSLYAENNNNLEFEIDKKKIMGRNNIKIPEIFDKKLIALSENQPQPQLSETQLATQSEIQLLENQLSTQSEIQELPKTVNPMLLLKKEVEIESKDTLNVTYIMAIGETKEQAIDLIEKYKNAEKIRETFELQRAKIEAENRYLMLNSKNILTYQEMLRELLYNSYFKKNTVYSLAQGFENKSYLKEILWKFGISGDIPYILIKIKNEFELENLNEVLKAYEYFKLKNIKIDLVIINEEEYSYTENLKSLINLEIQNNQIAYMINNGIYVLSSVEAEDLEVLEFRASLIIDVSKGNLDTIIKEQKQEYLEYQKYWNANTEKIIIPEETELCAVADKIPKTDFLDNLKFCNEYGGFSQDGKEYRISINKNHKLPIVWSNILANENFGTVVTETNGGYTWCKNSRLNKITAWNNNPIEDIPSEIIYLKDTDTNDYWTLGYSVIPKNIEYNILYGFGYVLYKQIYNEILQENQVYVPVKDNVKVNYINIRNLSNKPKKLKLLYYIKPVLGEDEIDTNCNIYTNLDTDNNIVCFKNLGGKFNISNNMDYANSSSINDMESTNSNNMSSTNSSTTNDMGFSSSNETSNIAYISSNAKIIAYTGSKKNFIGSGNISCPEALNRTSTSLLDNQNSIYEESIVVLEIDVELKEYENKEVTLILGEENSYEKIIQTKEKYTNTQIVKEELDNVKLFWNNKINKLQVKTPDEATNIILNGWNVYQTMVSRIYGKTGYYQSGGAIGFRDQLQDSIGIRYIDKELLRKQILKEAAHQFKEGDVLHWWHEETNRGIRTKFSDDLLWLPYAILEYINYTGDYDILKEKVPYLEGEILGENVDERYDLYLPRNIGNINEGNNTDNGTDANNNVGIGNGMNNSDANEGTLLEHMIKALKKGINIGENGFIKIGSGDWNDGFSTVGNKGIGESIWLTFFVYYILDNLNKLAIENGRNIISKRIEKILLEFRKNLDIKAWDGKWFNRAITDNGSILGSAKNSECKIDCIAQSWSIISNSVDEEKQKIAFESAEKYLIDYENKIIKLLTPSFDKSDLNPGYIRRYVNGVRENGGQYTHGSLWLVWAAVLLGYTEKAFDYYKLFIPINHSLDKKEADKYMVEPYVIAADIYGEGNLIGKGGWTWYTGASAWFYKIGIEEILGLKIKHERLSIKPCVPNDWNEYKIRYVYGNTVYNIVVKRVKRIKTNEETGLAEISGTDGEDSTNEAKKENGVNYGNEMKEVNVEKFYLNGMEIPEKEIKLVDNGKINDVEVQFI